MTILLNKMATVTKDIVRKQEQEQKNRDDIFFVKHQKIHWQCHVISHCDNLSD